MTNEGWTAPLGKQKAQGKKHRKKTTSTPRDDKTMHGGKNERTDDKVVTHETGAVPRPRPGPWRQKKN